MFIDIQTNVQYPLFNFCFLKSLFDHFKSLTFLFDHDDDDDDNGNDD